METILYVEDDPRNAEVAQLRLGRKYEVLVAPDDVSACELLVARPDIRVVLMDIELKGSQLDGVALTRLIRGKLFGELPIYAKQVPPSNLPVIIVSAYAHEGQVLLGDSGADDFLAKPVDFRRLALALAAVSGRLDVVPSPHAKPEGGL